MYKVKVNPECKALKDKDLLEATDDPNEFLYHHPSGVDEKISVLDRFICCTNGVNRSPFYAIGVIESDSFKSSNDELNEYLKENCPWYTVGQGAWGCDFPTTKNGKPELLKMIDHINKVWRSQHPIGPKVFQQENSSALSFLKHD